MELDSKRKAAIFKIGGEKLMQLALDAVRSARTSPRLVYQLYGPTEDETKIVEG